MQLETIDVTGLPEQVVEDIQNLIRSIRRNLPAQEPEKSLKRDPAGWVGPTVRLVGRHTTFLDKPGR